MPSSSSPPSPSETSLELAIDRLFQTPLSEFIAARNELASSLKKRGDTEGSKRVKQIAKPSLSAWAVNQLYWTARSVLDAVITAGDDYRRAQRAVLSGDTRTLEEEEDRRRAAIDEAERRAVSLLHQHGQDASPTHLRRIRTTLEALASYGSDNPSPVDGRFTADLDAPGFAALTTLGPIAPATARSPEVSASETVEPEPPSALRPSAVQEDERERRAQRLEEAERELAEARVSLEEASKRLESATADLRSAREGLTRAETTAKLAAEELTRERSRIADLESNAEIARRSWEEIAT